ncbi:MAG: ABC transporter permease subunit [Thioalkalispiraceae bacterium]|jgi:phosphate transport system permease protein
MSQEATTLTARQGANIRLLKDRLMSWAMAFGGISVIIAIVLIFFYLLYVVYPMFIPADMEKTSSYAIPAPDTGNTLHLALEEQNELAARFTDQGAVTFFNIKNGQTLKTEQLVDRKRKVTSFAHARLARGYIAFGLDNGEVIVARHKYRLVYGEKQRTIVPEVVFPLGQDPILLDEDTQGKLQQLALRLGDERATIAAATDNNTIVINRLVFDEEPDEEPVEFEKNSLSLPNIQNVAQLLINTDQRLLYIVHTDNEITMVDIDDLEDPQVLGRKKVVADGTQLTSVSLLTGEISLLVGDNKGNISQWFPVSTEQGLQLSQIRSFETQHGVISQIVTEQRRKGFVATDQNGQLGIYHSTAKRTLLTDKASDTPIEHLAVSPRADVVLTEDNLGQYQHWKVENEHPEVSWQVLWQQVWYESYDEPEYIWQSSSSSNDFEPKFSLMPLAFGTLKAAMYAMLFAVPLAIMGAIYTAYFMSPTMRTYVKPTIEIMEALPTVILGFLAGLWLAPMIESHLPGVFALLVFMPLGVLLFAFAWHNLPARIKQSLPDGWQAALLIPVVLFTGWLALSLSVPMENLLFGGDMKIWLGNNLGLHYDQRNSLVVGVAMGIAVIPTIFSITEDAIFSVPKHLTFGSLALGATTWQTLVRVVILTASPGIFSAVMIGLGRAVGETMIVLMATGNTPVMDLSVFQGMRTLSANIAVEMPESEVDSTHYRVLFLAALVLFIFTFMFNTLAEIVRQRLRKKYSSL